MRRKVRDRDHAAADPSECYLGSGFRGGGLSRAPHHGLDMFERRLAEQAFNRVAQLARELQCNADAGLVGPRLDRAQRLARDGGAAREFRLAYAASVARVSDTICSVGYSTGHSAIENAVILSGRIAF